MTGGGGGGKGELPLLLLSAAGLDRLDLLPPPLLLLLLPPVLPVGTSTQEYVLPLKFRGPSTRPASPTSSMKRCVEECVGPVRISAHKTGECAGMYEQLQQPLLLN